MENIPPINPCIIPEIIIEKPRIPVRFQSPHVLVNPP